MKKLVAAIAAAFLMTLGFVAVTEAPASAACPYSACINTTTVATAKAVVVRGRSTTVRVTVSAPGNAAPQGTLSLVVTRKGKVKFSTSVAYTGGQVAIHTSKLRKQGRYLAVATYTPAANSVFNGSSGSASFTVVKRR